MPICSRSLVDLRTCQACRAALNISALYSMVDQVRALKAQLTRTALQRELAIESLLIALLQVLAPPTAASSVNSRARLEVRTGW